MHSKILVSRTWWCCRLLLPFLLTAQGDGSDDVVTLMDFCGDRTHLEQIEAYISELYLSSRSSFQGDNEILKVLSNNGTGFQCHCDFEGNLVECRLWGRNLLSGCQFCENQQEIVLTDRLQFQTIESNSMTLGSPMWFESCIYGGGQQDDRASNPIETPSLFCERLELASTSSPPATTMIEDCSLTGLALECKICPEGTGTNLTFVSNGEEQIWASGCLADKINATRPYSTVSLLYQYHLNMQPFPVIIDDTMNPCDGPDNESILTVGEYCENLTSVEASFTQTLENIFSFSSCLNVETGFQCQCETINGGPNEDSSATSFRVVCDVEYSNSCVGGNFGQREEFLVSQEMILQQREDDGLFTMHSVGSCDAAISECFRQVLDYTGTEIVTCLERNGTVTAAFCELCPNGWSHADTLTPAWDDFSPSYACDENSFIVNPTSYFLRYRGLTLRLSSCDDMLPEEEHPSASPSTKSETISPPPAGTDDSMQPTTSSPSPANSAASFVTSDTVVWAIIVLWLGI